MYGKPATQHDQTHVVFGSPASLRLKDRQLTVETKSEAGSKTVAIPVEDVGMMMIYHPQITISGGLIHQLRE